MALARSHFVSTGIAAAFLAGLFTCRASTAQAEDAAGPIPQDSAKINSRRAALRANCEESFTKAYEKQGAKSQPWDQSAKECTSQLVEVFCGGRPMSIQAGATAAKHAEKAIGQGCDDPLIFAAAVHFAPNTAGIPVGKPKSYITAHNRLLNSDYPPLAHGIVFRGMLEFDNALRFSTATERERMVRAGAKVMLRLYRSNKTGEREIARDIFEQLLICTEKTNGDTEAVYQTIDKSLNELPAEGSVRLYLKGFFYYYRAWEIRSALPASGVTQDQLREHRQHLLLAKSAFESSWKLDPTDVSTACDMMDVCKGLGSPRTELENWFRRAMELNGDCHRAVGLKLDYLRPAWHGTAEAMLEHARQCAATKNYHGNLVSTLCDAHRQIAATSENRSEYYKDMVIWRELSEVYEGILRAYPNATRTRFEYLGVANQAEQFDKSRELLMGFDADTNFDLIGGKQRFDQFKALLLKKLDKR